MLDESQAQTLDTHLDETAATQVQGPDPGGISGMGGMELEKIDTTVQSMKKLTTGIRSMMEGVGGLQDLRPPAEPPGAPSANQ